ncbi:hypothetical protein CDIK_2781 [Cucumispora dikerogammari]|nr:hypothetical protein CDIK_2781 [Cucumispora dikerogammari]
MVITRTFILTAKSTLFLLNIRTTNIHNIYEDKSHKKNQSISKKSLEEKQQFVQKKDEFSLKALYSDQFYMNSSEPQSEPLDLSLKCTEQKDKIKTSVLCDISDSNEHTAYEFDNCCSDHTCRASNLSNNILRVCSAISTTGKSDNKKDISTGESLSTIDKSDTSGHKIDPVIYNFKTSKDKTKRPININNKQTLHKRAKRRALDFTDYSSEFMKSKYHEKYALNQHVSEETAVGSKKDVNDISHIVEAQKKTSPLCSENATGNIKNDDLAFINKQFEVSNKNSYYEKNMLSKYPIIVSESTLYKNSKDTLNSNVISIEQNTQKAITYSSPSTDFSAPKHVFCPISIEKNSAICSHTHKRTHIVYYKPGLAKLQKYADFPTNTDLKRHPFFLPYLKITNISHKKDGRCSLDIAFMNIPVFFKLDFSGVDKNNFVLKKKQKRSTCSFFMKIKINVTVSKNKTGKMIEILPTLVFYKGVHFFEKKYKKQIDWWVFLSKPKYKPQTALDLDSSKKTVLYNYKKKRFCENKKKTSLRAFLNELSLQKNHIESDQSKNYNIMMKIIIRFEQLYKHLDDIKLKTLPFTGLKTGIKEIYDFHKEFLSCEISVISLTAANRFEQALILAFDKVYKNLKSLTYSIIASYNMYIREESEDELDYY